MASYTGTNGDDSYWGGPDADQISGQGGRDYLLGNGGNDEISGGDGNDNLHGGDGDDLLEGGEGDDALQGNWGADILRGGAGNDRLLLLTLPVAGDLADGGDGIDTLQFDGGGSTSITFSIADPSVAQSLYGGTVVNIEKLSFRSGSGNDDITGGALDDYIDGFDGNDRIDGGFGNDNLDGGSGTDTVLGGGGNDSIRGGSGDSLYGGEGDDTFFWSGDALVDGGAGIDELRMDTAGTWADLVVELRDPASESVILGTRVTGVERLRFFSGDGHDRLTGNAGDDLLSGNAGNDIIRGGDGKDSLHAGDGAEDQLFGEGGDDSLNAYESGNSRGFALIDGGDGFDTLSLSVINYTGALSIDLQDSSGDVRNVEQINFSGSGPSVVRGGEARDSMSIFSRSNSASTFDGRGGDDHLIGAGGADTMYGGDGNDFIDGGWGADSLYGGDGDDIVRTNGTEASLIEGGEGRDELGGGAGADTLRGGGGDNRITGSDGGDILEGGAGGDRFFYSIISHSTASARDRILDFQTGADKIDLLNLGRVSLTLSEAADPDTGDAYTLVEVTSAQGTLHIRVDGTIRRSDFVMVSGTGTEADDTIVGTSAGETLQGLEGNDILQGHGGDDRLEGGEGDDRLIGGDGDDSYDGGAGVDTGVWSGEGGPVAVNLHASLSFFPAGHPHATRSLAPGEALDGWGNYETLTSVENVVTTTNNDQVQGSDGANRIESGGGSDIVDGMGGDDVILASAGNDQVSGGDGNDRIEGDDGGDTLFGDAGDDSIDSGAGNDFAYGGLGGDSIAGGAGDDILRGEDGNDILTGGDGYDLLRGGSGVDSFDGGGNPGGTEPSDGFGDRISFFETRATQGAVADLRTGIISNDGFGNAETMMGIESLGGDTAFADTFYGNDSRNGLIASRGDSVYGFGANDLFDAAAAPAVVDGGDGIDQLVLRSDGAWLLPDSDGDGAAEAAPAMSAGWTVNLAAGTLRDGYGNLGTVAGIENVTGSALGDDIRGDAVANTLAGGDGNDFFRLQDGGDDAALGGLGGDAFYFGSAYTAGDVIDGGDGRDQLALQGNYALVLGSLTGIEDLILLSGTDIRFGAAGTAVHHYSITTTNENVAAGKNLLVDGTQLLAGESFTFDGSAEMDGTFTLSGGLGTDILKGGAGSDGFYFRDSAFWNPGDRVIGGANDQIGLRGDFTIAVGPDQINGVTTIVLMSGVDIRFGPIVAPTKFDITMHDGNLAAGQRFTIDGTQLAANETARIDASAEQDGFYRLFGGSGADELIGSKGADLIRGNGGADRLTGGAGADRFVYGSAADSTGLGFDILTDARTSEDKLDLHSTVAGWNLPVSSGQLSAASFDADLAAALDGALSANHAILFDPSSGDFAGRHFLIVDANGDGAYTAGQDYVFERGAGTIIDIGSSGFFV